MPKKALNPKQEYRAYQLHYEDGFSQTKVASLYGVSQGTISNVLKKKYEEKKESGDEGFKNNAAKYGVIMADGNEKGGG